MCCYPPVELIYVEFYLPPHLDISRVIITTLYMPVHSARRHIHQALVTGYSFINDQIHFCRITALWCTGEDAVTPGRQTHRLAPLNVWPVVVLLWLWRIMMDSCRTHSHDHIQWQNENFEPIGGSGDGHGERQDVSFIFRKFYFQVFNLLSFFGPVSRIWQPPTLHWKTSGKDDKLSWLVSFLWQVVKLYNNRIRQDITLNIYYFKQGCQYSIFLLC